MILGGRWRRTILAVMISVVVSVGLLALSEDGRDLLWALPWAVLDLGAKKDWWAGEGDIALAIPRSLSERIGSAPFHWRFLVHRTADGEASVILYLTQTPSVLPDQPSRSFWAHGRMQEPGLGDKAVMATAVRLPWEEFSEPWHKAIDGQWQFERDGDAFSVLSIATEERIPLPLDDDWWEKAFAYHYWKPEDGPRPSHEDLSR